jgi:hypothetical protein
MQKFEATRNLLIVQNPPAFQDPADWIAIRERIERDAPDIEVRIVDNGQPNLSIEPWLAQRPSLIFSACGLVDFAPRSGAVFCGHLVPKDKQMQRLAAIGILTPKTAILSSDASFDPKVWGEYVIAKPNGNSHSGQNVKLVRTIDIPERYDELVALTDRHVIVQQYIDHSEDGYPTHYRVLTMFGRALFCGRNRWVKKRPPLAEIAADPHGVIASNDDTMGGHVRTICDEKKIIVLGERTHEAFPECPVLGPDIVRDTQSGRLYVLEMNPYGAVWHLSSFLAKELDPEHVRARYAQFNALDRAADLLIQKTRSDAR